MDPAAVLEKCRSIAPDFDTYVKTNPLQGFRLVKETLAEKPRKELSRLRPFLEALDTLESDFARTVERDPMLLYLPAHEVALAFHTSGALVRYFRGGNRTSKTQSGYAEHYFVATGQHKWRQFLAPPTASFIIGVNFSKYAPKVFDAKFVKGEADNPLSPMFPEGGKWFNRYDDRKHVIYIACPECAVNGRAGTCKHLRSTITLFSDMEGIDVLMGGQYNLGHFDEHISEEFYDESIQRLQTVRHSSLIVTGTPLHGENAWEHQKLTSIFDAGSEANRVVGTEIPFVSLHTIDQYAAGLIPKEKIDTWRKSADPLDVQSRVFGIPSPLAKRSVFDRFILHEMRAHIRAPMMHRIDSGFLTSADPVRPDRDGQLAVWDLPEPGGKYIIGCDVAVGLTNRDFSCASVVKCPELKLVAQLHGWIDPVEYAWKLNALGLFYNKGYLAVERNGPGSGTVLTLRQLGYENLFREVTDIAQTQFVADAIYGIDTNIRSKAYMVAFLKKAVAERSITIPSGPTLKEMGAFGQETLGSGENVRLRGEGGSHDDRVMSLVFAIYVALAYSLFDFTKEKRKDSSLSEDDQRTWEGFKAQHERNDAMRRNMKRGWGW